MAISWIGRTNARARSVPFGIEQAARLQHMYVIGQTGTGKTSLLEGLARQDIGVRGVAVIDPHGDLFARLSSTRCEAVRIDLADPTLALGYNPLARVSASLRPLVASGILSTFRKTWPDAWGVRMEHVLRNTLLALLDQNRAQLPDVLRMLSEKAFRKGAIARIENEQVRAFWISEMPGYSERNWSDMIAPIQNKVGAFLTDPRLRRFVCPEGEGLRFRRIMDRGEALLVNLSKGAVGEDSASIVGSLLVNAIALAALSRSELTEQNRHPFFLYIDEFQSFTTLALAEMLSELRKFGVGMVLAHQYLGQLDPEIRRAVLGNVGTTISFRVGPEDAHALARQFEPEFSALDLMNLPNRHIYLRLMIDGAPSKPFSAVTERAGSS